MAVRSKQMVPSTSSRVLIKVDEYTGDRIAGRLYNPYLEKGGRFGDLVELANKLDEMFDALSFPQAAMSYRQFDTRRRPTEPPPPRTEEDTGPIGQQEADVFIVHVQFRQNADWQGTVTWAGGPQEMHFRSTLELFKAMDAALAASHPEARAKQ